MALRVVRVLSLAAVEVGALVGGGFASGREVVEFFARHGAGGRAGIALFVVLMAIAGGLLLDVARRGRTTSYRELTRQVAGERVADLADPLVALALFLGLAVTVAGAGALFATAGWGSRVAGILLAVAATGLVVGSGSRGVVAANVVIVPALAALVLVVCGWPAVASPPWHAAPTLIGPPGRSSVLYFLYNGLLAVVLFASLGTELRQAADGWLAGPLAAFVLGLLALGVYEALVRRPELARQELPLLSLAQARGEGLRTLYAAALAAALLTTAIGNAFGLAARFADAPNRLSALASILAGAGALALVGFAPLVRYGYRLVAVAGAAYLVMLAIAAVTRAAQRSRGGASSW